MSRPKGKGPQTRSVKIPLSDKPLPIEPLVLRPAQAAKLLNISERTLWDWLRRDPRFEVIRPSPGVTFITLRSIRAVAGV
jgi:hypothetical protein